MIEYEISRESESSPFCILGVNEIVKDTITKKGVFYE